MAPSRTGSVIGVLASGGLDSCVLTAHLLRQGRTVRPLYVRCGLLWEPDEFRVLRAFLRAVETPRLMDLAVLDMPLEDLYGDHWSLNGYNSPGAQGPDTAVYLPARNALLTIKPAIWCAMHGVGELALAILKGNPFADAGDEFFRTWEAAIEQAAGSRLKFVRPFAGLTKREVVELGRDLSLELTFSCIAPVDGLHCGQCNKCAERQRAFTAVAVDDPTLYANRSPVVIGGKG